MHVVATILPPFLITIADITNRFANHQASPLQQLVTPPLCTRAADVVDSGDEDGEIGGTHLKKMNFEIGRQLSLLNIS